MPEEEKSKLFQSVYDHADDLPKCKALQLLSDHLQGEWSTSTEEDIDVSVIESGFVNRLFLCHNKKSDEKVVVRLYGGKILAMDGNILRNIGLEGEVLIFHLMDVNKIGPKLLGVFDGGRIEEYLDGSEILSNEEIENEETMEWFARKLAKMHSLKVPVCKKPKDFLKIIRESFEVYWPSYHKEMIEKEIMEGTPQPMIELANLGMTFDMFEIIEYYEKMFSGIKTRIVFGQNDTNRANWLVTPTKHGWDRVHLIDYEFCGYNYRGCDIGHHFKHRTQDMKKFAEKRMDAFVPIEYPTEEARRLFIRNYLDEARKHFDSINDHIDNENDMLIEAEFFGGLYQMSFLAFIVRDRRMFKKLDLPIHPGVMIGSMIQDYRERKARIADLQQRFGGKKN
jgi:choline/ethanolamine kinase